MNSNHDEDLAAIRRHDTLVEIAEAIHFGKEQTERAQRDALAAIAAAESLPEPSYSELENNAKSRIIEALNRLFVRLYRCEQALGNTPPLSH